MGIVMDKCLGCSEVHVHVRTAYSVGLIWEISFSSAIKLHVFTVIIKLKELSVHLLKELFGDQSIGQRIHLTMIKTWTGTCRDNITLLHMCGLLLCVACYCVWPVIVCCMRDVGVLSV